MLRTYWRTVHRRAAREAAAILGLDSKEQIVIKAAVALAVLLALAFWGSEDAARDEIVVRTVIAGIVIFLFPLFYLYKLYSVPAHMADEQQRAIDDLETHLVPQLDFVWKMDTVNEVESAGSPATIEGKIGQVIVRNRSELATARAVEVALISYNPLDCGGARLINARVYSDSTQELRVNINPGREEVFNLFKVKYRFNKLMLGPFASRRRNNLAPGKYQVKIIASAEIGRPVGEECFLKFDGYDSIEFRQWKPSDAEND